MFDIAANLSDEVFKGVYNRKEKHKPDFEHVIERAREFGVEKFLLSAGHIEDALESYKLSKQSDDFFMTIGCHPCRANETVENGMTPELYSKKIEETIESFEDKSKLVAIGECGLDYDRLNYADKETQLKAFPFHFDLAQKYSLPMYLHSRST